MKCGKVRRGSDWTSHANLSAVLKPKAKTAFFKAILKFCTGNQLFEFFLFGPTVFNSTVSTVTIFLVSLRAFDLHFRQERVLYKCVVRSSAYHKSQKSTGKTKLRLSCANLQQHK